MRGVTHAAVVVHRKWVTTKHPTRPTQQFWFARRVKNADEYKKISFDDVWSAALRSIDEIGFLVLNATKEIGLIHAEARMNADPRYLPPLMNVIIRKENSRIDVNFHIELPGQRDDTGKRRSYANQFFKALKKTKMRMKK